MKLYRSDLHLHLTLWRPNLDPDEERIIVVPKVLFYGVSSTVGIRHAAMYIMIKHASGLWTKNTAFWARDRGTKKGAVRLRP